MSEQLPLGEPRARTTDPPTSHEAARSVTDLTAKQRAVLFVYERSRGPLTDGQMIEFYSRGVANNYDWYPRQSSSGLRTRRSELERAGFLREVDKVRLPTGRMGRRFERAR